MPDGTDADVSSAEGIPTLAITVDPRRSMRAATRELDVALDRLGADLEPSKRRAAALLASELVAQVVGRDLDEGIEPVALFIELRPDAVRLEARGSGNGFRAAPDNAGADGDLAAWGHYLLMKLADRWGVAEDPPLIWAEVSRP